MKDFMVSVLFAFVGFCLVPFPAQADDITRTLEEGTITIRITDPSGLATSVGAVRRDTGALVWCEDAGFTSPYTNKAGEVIQDVVSGKTDTLTAPDDCTSNCILIVRGIMFLEDEGETMCSGSPLGGLSVDAYQVPFFIAPVLITE